MAPRSKGSGRTDSSSTPSKQTVGFQVTNSTDGRSSSERLSYALTAAIGSQAVVELKNGETHQGVYMAGGQQGKDWSVTLSDVQSVNHPNAQTSARRPWVTKKQFSGQDVMHVTVKDVNLGSGIDGASNRQNALSTDADISKASRRDLVGRELVRWEPDADSAALEDLSLDNGPKHKSGHWDQFEAKANKAQYDVNKSFDEDLYTTKLDKSKAKISERDAARIAAEIEGKRTSNAHQAEERGQIAYREVDEDEEARYSAVDRGSSSAAGAEPSRGSGPGTRENGGKAWANAAGSVAAVSGRPAKSSAPIDMDPRKEHNKVRMQLTGKVPTANSSRDRSPYGTPKSGRFTSPLVGNASQVEALDLNPGSARYDAGVRSEFAKFKKANRQEGTSPSESELAKAPSIEVSPKSGSAPSTPEDRGAPPQQAKAHPGNPPSAAAVPAAGAESWPRPSAASAVRGAPPTRQQPQGPPSPGGRLNQGPPSSVAPQGSGHLQLQTPPSLRMPHSHMPGGVVPHGRGQGSVPLSGQAGGFGPQQPGMPVMSLPGPPNMQMPMHMQGPQIGAPGGPRPGQMRQLNFGAPIPGMPTPGTAGPYAAPPFHTAEQTQGQQRDHSGQPSRPQPSQAPASLPSTPAASRPTTSKLNPNAREFKLNPTAKAFVPGASAPLSRAPSNASSVTNAGSISGGATTSAGPTPHRPARGGGSAAASRPVGGQPERRTSRELPSGIRPQPRSPPSGGNSRFRGGSAPVGQASFPMGPHPPGAGLMQQPPRYVSGPQGYPVSYMQQTTAGMYMAANGQGMMPYVAFSPTGGAYEQPFPVVYGGVPMGAHPHHHGMPHMTGPGGARPLPR